MKVACIQLRSGIDRASNVTAAGDLIRQAANDGATFIATPEMTNVLDKRSRRLFGHLPQEDQLTEIRKFSILAKELNIHLLIGSMAVALNNDPGTRKMVNRSYLFGPAGVIATYDKIHLFDVNLPTGESWLESAQVQGGREAVVATTPFAKIGMTVCYDIRFPHLYRALARAGAQILMVPAAFTVPTGQAHWETLLRARAIETGSFVMAPAQGGAHEDERLTYGHSMIVDPWGRVVAQKDDNEPGVLIADIDLSLVEETRARIPSLGLDIPVKLRMLPR